MMADEDTLYWSSLFEDIDDEALALQASLATSAAISAADLDVAYQLQIFEAVEASAYKHGPSNPCPSNQDLASSSSGLSFPDESTDAAYALAVYASGLKLTEENRRDALTCRESQDRSNDSLHVTIHDALFARELAAVSDDQWASRGDHFSNPLDSDSPARYYLFFKGMVSSELVEPPNLDPGVAVLAVVVYGPKGQVVQRIQKPLEGFSDGGVLVDLMALKEGLDATIELGIQRVKVFYSSSELHRHLNGFWRYRHNRSRDKNFHATVLGDITEQVLLLQRKFQEYEIAFAEPNQYSECVMELAQKYLDSQIVEFTLAHAPKDERELCKICYDEFDVSQIHSVSSCGHRFCFSCMKIHLEVTLRDGRIPVCPEDGCNTELTVERSKTFLSPELLNVMMERLRERQIPPSERIYCPNPECAALMSLTEMLKQRGETCFTYHSSSLRKCDRCGGSFCISCMAPWHEGLTCYFYKKKHPPCPEDAKLQKLVEQKLWRRCVKCKQMIELSEGCFHMTCVCGYEFCYTCGKEWTTCSCPLWEERFIMDDQGEGEEHEEEVADDDPISEDEDSDSEGHLIDEDQNWFEDYEDQDLRDDLDDYHCGLELH